MSSLHLPSFLGKSFIPIQHLLRDTLLLLLHCYIKVLPSDPDVSISVLQVSLDGWNFGGLRDVYNFRT